MHTRAVWLSTARQSTKQPNTAGCNPAAVDDRGDQARARAQLALNKVTNFLESPNGEEFPQTSTIFQWYGLEEFEPYSHLGYLMGWAHLANIKLSEGELRPNAACRVLYCGMATGVKNLSAHDRRGYGPVAPYPPE